MTRRRELLSNLLCLNTANGKIIQINAASLPLNKCQINFYPVQAGSGDPSPENYRAISGLNNVDISIANISSNLFNTSNASWGYIQSNGSISSDYRNNLASAYLPVSAGDHVLCAETFCYASGAGPQIAFYSSTSSSSIIKRYNYGASGTTVRNFIAPTGSNYMRAYFNPGSLTDVASKDWFLNNVTCYVLIGTTYTTTFPSTYYCGYVDLLQGTVIKTHEYLKMDGTTTGKKMGYKGSGTSTNNYYLQLYDGGYMDQSASTWVTGAVMTANNMISSIGKNVNQSEFVNSSQDYIGFGAYINSGRTQLQPRLIFPYSTTELETIEKCNAWIKDLYDAETPFEFVYPLKTASSTSVTSQSITPSAGTNYVWSSTGVLDIAYWSH